MSNDVVKHHKTEEGATNRGTNSTTRSCDQSVFQAISTTFLL